MATGAYVGVDDKARKLKSIYVGVDSVARKVKSGYVGVNGVARQFWQTGTPISDLAVGDSVYMNVDGVSTEFLVVHQGRPSTTYDSSCNGTWLLMKDIYIKQSWYTSNNNNYSGSTVHTYLNNTFAGLLDSDIKNIIKQVKIPYTNGKGTSGTLATGSSGLSTKIFLLSRNETGAKNLDSGVANQEGTALNYFVGSDGSLERRIAYFDGTATGWYTRSPYIGNDTQACYVSQTGQSLMTYTRNQQGIRPALILPSTTLVDSNFNVIA